MTVAGHCISIDGDWWHEPGCCIGAPVNCSGDCCKAPTKWFWIECFDAKWHGFDDLKTGRSVCGQQWIDRTIVTSAKMTDTIRTLSIPFKSCESCRRNAEKDYRQAGITDDW